MTYLGALSIAAPALAGFFIISALLPGRTILTQLPLKASLGAGLGAGIYSSCYFAWALFPPFSIIRLVIMESGLLALSALFYCLMHGHGHNFPAMEQEPANPVPRMERALECGFYCALTVMSGTFVLCGLILPHGGWDAWQTWNLLARIMSRGGDQWTTGFSAILAPHHPDYPLLLPALIARGWKYAGGETVYVQIAVAALYSYGTIILLFAALAAVKCRSQGFLAGLILTGTPSFVLLGAEQWADVPLGFYFLATFVMLALRDRFFAGNNCLVILAGVLAGFSSWTKNEGLLFLATVILARFIAILRFSAFTNALKETLFFISGTSMVIIIVLYFKIAIAPPNDIFSAQGHGETWHRLLQFSNYPQIVKAFFTSSFGAIPFLYMLLIYPVCLGKNTPPSARAAVLTGTIALALMLCGYFFVYVITPYDICWHLKTSLSRLFIQLWPSFLFLFFLVMRTPEQALSLPAKRS